MKRDVSWSAVVVVAAAVAVIAFSGYLLASWPPDPPESTLPASSTPSTSTAPSASPSASQAPEEKTAVAVIGDSFSVGDPASSGPPWPQILADDLGWRVQNESVNGSGYVAGKPFDIRVQQVVNADPDVIIVAGGERDLGRPVPEVTAAAEDVISRLAEGAPDAQIVVLSPFSKGNPGPLTNQFGEDLRAIAQANEAEYVDATQWLVGDGTFVANDGVHPTEAGQQRIAKRLEKALVRLGIAEQPNS